MKTIWGRYFAWSLGRKKCMNKNSRYADHVEATVTT